MGAESDGNDPLVRERELKLDSIFHTLEQLNSLKRFDWTSSGPLHLHEFLAGIAEAGERMPSMESVHIRVRYVACPLRSADTAVVANRRTQLLERILVTKQSACKFILTASYANIFRTERDSSSSSFHLVSFRTGKDLILTFIKRHGLPIQFRPSSTDIY
jgi:L-ribulose-5-phosphate 3-epimerase UlaE